MKRGLRKAMQTMEKQQEQKGQQIWAVLRKSDDDQQQLIRHMENLKELKVLVSGNDGVFGFPLESLNLGSEEDRAAVSAALEKENPYATVVLWPRPNISQSLGWVSSKLRGSLKDNRQVERQGEWVSDLVKDRVLSGSHVVAPHPLRDAGWNTSSLGA